MEDVHKKAIRLIEGDIVEVSGLCVRLSHSPSFSDTCYCCEMDCLCHKGNPICELCEECNNITNEDCFLILVS